MPSTNSLSLPAWATTTERVSDRVSERTVERVEVSARIWHGISGRLMALVGLFNIVLGTVIASKRRTALGHRQRVIGVLQSNCEVDRQAANAFVDRWMSKHPGLRVH